ncbi:phage tail length tape measure family protein [Janthinobacterium sp. UMAB-60]|uniref:phage tail length tape measure family protein n=1 Tax=Janthinobacterium sp. UMAB-60 TaxID=1365365 RepID=UPI001C5829C6|nr:phage tail length tape measure family protein [Janthinobacterium sp. UMAB-60]
MPDIAELGLSIDTRQLEQGAQAMDRLGAASERVEKKVDSATTAVARLGDASASAKGKVEEGAVAVSSVGDAGERALRMIEPARAAMLLLGYAGISVRSGAAEAALGLDALSGSAASIARQALDPAKNAMLMLGYSGAGVQSAAVQAAQGLDMLRAAAESVARQGLDPAKNAMLLLGHAGSSVQAGVSSASTALDVLGGSASNTGQRTSVVWEVLDRVGNSASGVGSRALVAAETFENLGRSASNISPRAISAADAIENLGATTERTWKKQADYNGAMNDTSRLMRDAAEASRNLEDSKHRLLVELQREIDVFGMSRSELERYRAAEQGLGLSAQNKAAALGSSIDAMHREERAARDAAAAEDQATQAGDRFIKNLRDQVATLGMTTQQLQAYRAAQLGVSDAAAPLINKLAEAGAGAKSAGGHMEGLSFQSASAKRELLVLAHELSQGQFQRFGGSMMVLGEQTGAASLLFSAAGLAALAFAGALGTVAYAMIKGASEQREMNNALISTNNYAGVTSDKLNEMAHAATEAGGSIREAKKVVTELAGTGKFTGDQIAYITDAVIALEHATGESVKKTIKEFESLAVQSTGSTNRATEVITRATVKLDDTYHFLTLSVYEAIRALEKDGDAKGASAVATEAFAKATKDGAEQMIANLGSVARAWHGVKEAIGGAMDAIGSYGAKATPAADVKKYSFRLSEFDKGLADSNLRLGRAPDAITPELQATRTQIVLGLTDAVDKLNKADAVAMAQGEVATKNSRAVHAAAMIHAEDIRLQKKGMGELAVALDAYQSNIDAIRAADPNSPLISPDAIAAGIAARTKAHTEQAKPKADQVENTQLADQIKQYEKEAATAKAHYDALGKLDDMYLRGGELSVQQAYENKRSYATKTYEAQIDAYDLELDALTSHNSRTSGEAAKHEKQINEILGKRDAAEKAFFDESFRRDEEERLRQAAIATAASDAANKEIAAINAQVAAVEEQIRTYGLLPAQKTALAVADLEEQKAALASFEGNEKVIDGINRKIEAMKRLGIVQSKASTQEQGGDVAKAKELLDILTAVDTATKSAAQGMAASFGAVGTAIGGLTTALSGYAVQQQAIAAQLAAATKDAYGDPTKVAKAQAAAAQQGAQAQIKSYGDMASAAKGFFKENSTGYKVMETAEKAFRAYEMAMAVESMVKKIFFKEAEVAANLTLNATKVGGEAAASAASTGLAATEASAWGITAVVKALASLPFPMNLAAGAATLAAVVAIGAKMLGGVGGGSVSVSEQRQAANGTGSVLGDSSAKSESIAHSLAIMEKNSGLGLAYSASMASSLRQVVDGIGGLGGLLVRNSGVTGSMAADTKGGAASFGASTLGVALTGGVIGLTLDKLTGGLVGKITGGILGSIFGGKTTTLDTGVMLNKASLTSIQMGGVSASQYTDTKTSGGWFSRDKNRTALSSLGGEANDQFTKIILGLRDTIQSSATALGMGGAVFTAQLNTFVVDLGKISLKNLKGDELQKALETAFSKLGDDMAKFGVGGLEQYQAVGEGYLETLARVANDYMQVSDVLAVLGKSFNTTGLGAVALSESLIAAAGGLDKLTSGTSYFVENFLTEAERMAPITKSVNDAMGKLGISGVTTVDQFKALVLAQDLNTTAGQAMYVGLIALAEPFKKAADYAAELAGTTGDLAAANKTASEIASERRDLQQQLNELTKSETALLAIQRAAIADVNKALFDQVQAAKAVVSAKDALGKAYDREAAAAQTALDKSKSWVATLNGLNASMALGGQSTLTPEQKYAEARAQFEKTLAAANAGDTTAQSGLSAAEQAFLTASQVVNASDARYAADYARVLAANDEALKWASAQVDVQQASLDALKAQVSGLITINDSVLTVAQAIANLQAAMGTATGLGVKFDGSHAGGLANVPFDGYAAELHRGEVVVDAPAAAAMRRYFGGAPSQGGGNTDALVAEIKRLNEKLDKLNADTNRNAGATIQATVESNDKAAKTVVAGVDKSAKSSAWANTVKGEYA